MKTLKAGDFPSCETCIYIANVGYKRCQLKPFMNEDGELFSPTISDYVDKVARKPSNISQTSVGLL